MVLGKLGSVVNIKYPSAQFLKKISIYVSGTFTRPISHVGLPVASVNSMATFLELPQELRANIYRWIFVGERLQCRHYSGSTRDERWRWRRWTDDWDRFRQAKCTTILFTSRQCLCESRPLLLDFARINISEDIDPWYCNIKSLVLSPAMLKHVHLDVDELLDRFTTNRGCPATDKDPIRKCLLKLENLQSLTFMCDEGYGFDVGPEMENGWITDKGIDAIKKKPNRLLGLNDLGTHGMCHTPIAFYAVAAIIKASKTRNQSFRLMAVVDVSDTSSDLESSEEEFDSEASDEELSPSPRIHMVSTASTAKIR